MKHLFSNLTSFNHPFSRWKFFLIVLQFFIFSSFIAQNPVWNLAPNYSSEGLPPQSLPQPTPPSGLSPDEQEFYYYHGLSATAASNAQADAQGNLLFFIVDDKVYDKDGYLIDQLFIIDGGKIPVKGTSEIVIVPEPGNCQRYFVFLSGYDFLEGYGYDSNTGSYNLGDAYPYYAIIDMSLPNIFSLGQDAAGVGLGVESCLLDFGERNGVVVTNNNYETLSLLENYSTPTGNHFYSNLFASGPVVQDAVNGDFQYVFVNSASTLYAYKISSAGVTYESQYLYSGTPGSGSGEMELIKIANNHYRIAFPTRKTSAGPARSEILTLEFDPQQGNFVTGSEVVIDYYDEYSNGYNHKVYFHGLEFSPDGNLLYYSHTLNASYSNNLEYYNFTTATINALNVSSQANYQWGQIEMGLNDRMYFASASNIAYIENPNVPPSSFDGSVSVPINLSSLGRETNAPNFDMDEIGNYNLPDQIDGLQDYSASFFTTCQCCEDNSYYDIDRLTVASTATWTVSNNPFNPGVNEIYVKNELRIPAGVTLTLDGLVFKFSPSAKVVIEAENGANPPEQEYDACGDPIPLPNVSSTPGRLIMKTTTFTVDDYCHAVADSLYDLFCENPMWHGVEILGHPNLSQYAHSGYLHMKSNSKIEHAITGVKVGTSASNSGGIVKAYNSVFHNNLTDVSMMTYNGSTNLSKFQDTDFIVDDMLNNQQLTLLKNRVYLYKVSGVNFIKCNFKILDNALMAYPLNNRGYGINAVASKFTVKGSCNVPISYPQVCDEGDITARWLGTAQSDVTPSRFENFLYGIRSFGQGVQDQVVVRNTIFEDNRSAIFLNNNDNSTLFKNKFIIPSGPAADTYYGAYLQGCTGYTIERNYFRGTDLQERHCGLWINNSGIDPNEIYLNDFEHLYLGTGVLNQNQNDVADHIGLELLCGEYIKNEYDIALIGENARMSDFQGDYYNEAGNIFDIYDSGNESHIFVDQLPGVEGFRYFHHQENTYNVEPDFISTPLPQYPATAITLDNLGTPFYSRLASCPTFAKKTKLEQKNTVEQKRETINQLEFSLQSLIDNGSTASLLNVATSTTYSSSAIRIALLQASPFLSDVVLQAVINRDQPLNQWHLCEVLLANSPLSSDVWQTYESQAPLAEYLHNLLLQYQDGTSTYMNQLSQINAERKVKERALKGFVNEVMKDSISINVNEINDLMVDEELNRKIKAQVSLADMVGNTAEALALLDDYDATPTDKWKDVMEIYFSIVANDNVISQDQIADLETIANSQDQGRFEAQSVLVLYTDQDFEEEINYPDDNKSFNAKPAVKPITKRKPELAGVYPNPAKGEFYITYVLPTEKESASIDIYNLEGKLVRSEDVSNGYGILPLNSQAFEAGIYVFNLQLNGETVATQKFTVVE